MQDVVTRMKSTIAVANMLMTSSILCGMPLQQSSDLNKDGTIFHHHTITAKTLIYCPPGRNLC